MPTARSGFSLVELMIVVAITSILAAIAAPNFRMMQYRAKRAEVPLNVSGIWTAEIAFNSTEDGFITLPLNPSSTPTKDTRPFDASGTEWRTLGWEPDGPVRGSYWVTTTSTQFTVYGISDVDGDSVQCQYTASDSHTAVLRGGDERVF